jgi:replication initiation protein RepC
MNAQLDAKNREPGISVEKWKVFDAIKSAKHLLGVSDRALTLLNALLTFYPVNSLSGEQPIIVFPSNKSLANRAHGMSETTLRYYLRTLVTLCFIIRNDSPNGKRYARKGQGGQVEVAYGFDLSPLLARSEEFFRLAAEAKEQEQSVLLMRERITICRRDIDKMIATGIYENIPADWEGFREAYKELNKRLPRKASLDFLTPLGETLENLAAQIYSVLEGYVKENNTQTQKPDGNDGQSSGHIQNSTTKSIFESETSLTRLDQAEISPLSTIILPSPINTSPKRPEASLPLSMVLEACPEIADFAQGGPIKTWRDFCATAAYIRPFLGISPSGWEEAVEVLGPKDAAIAVAAINQRLQAITSPGGYLRSLTQKSREGRFSIIPVVQALIRAGQRKAGKLRA